VETGWRHKGAGDRRGQRVEGDEFARFRLRNRTEWRSLRSNGFAKSAVHRELKRCSPEALWKVIDHRFRFFNRDILERAGPIPWEIPEYLGGLGLVPSKEYTRLTRVLATDIITNDIDRIQIQSDEVLWNMHEIVINDLRQFEGTVPDAFAEVREKVLVNLSSEYTQPDFHIVKDQFRSLYKTKVIELLFKCETITDVFAGYYDGTEAKVRNSVERKNGYRLRNNQNVWKDALGRYEKNGGVVFLRGSAETVKIRTQQEIQHEKKDFFLANFKAANSPVVGKNRADALAYLTDDLWSFFEI
jgi:hypothetical protein